MQPKLANRDESAWEKGDLAYDLGDTVETGIAKAAQEGIKPGIEGYAAFVTAFARRVRSKQLSPRKVLSQVSEMAQEETAIALTSDFSRTAC